MTVKLSRETEQSLETYLSQKGLGTEAMSDVIEEAIEAFLFRQLLKESHEQNSHLEADDVEAMVEEEIRKHRYSQLNS